MSSLRDTPEIKKIFPLNLAIIFILFSAAIVLSGIFYYKTRKKRTIAEQEMNLSAIASLKISQIENWRKERMGDAKIIMKDGPLIRRISNYYSGSKTELQTELTDWMKSLTAEYDYKNVLIADTSFRVRLSVSPGDSVLGDSGREDIKTAMKDRVIVFTDLHKSKEIPYIHFDIIIPLLESDGKKQLTVGVAVLRIDPGKVLFPLIQSWPTISKTSETLIVRKDGDSVLFLNDLRFRQRTALKLKFPLSYQSLLASKAVNGVEGVLEGMDYRNVVVVGYLARIEGFNWFMVAKVDKEEILSPLKRYVWLIIVVVVLLVVINASILGFWIWNQQIRSYQIQFMDERIIRESQEKLQESEERFRSLYENSTIGIYRTTLDGKILMANTALVKMLGFSSFEELSRRNLEEEGYEPDYPRSKFQETLQKKGRIIGLESAWHRRNGDTLYVRESATVIKDAEGNILYYDGNVEDITYRKLAEEALRESEDKFKYVFDHSVAAKSITFPSGEIHVNKAFCDLTGYTPEELENSKWQDITYPEDVKLTDKVLQPLISGKKISTRFIKRYIHKNGNIVWADVGTALRCDENGNPLYFMTTALDITERKMAENALIESERMLRESHEIAQLGAYEWNLTTGFWSSSAVLDTIFGIDDKYARSLEGWVNIVHPQWQKIMNDYVTKEVIGNLKKFDKEYQIIRQNDGSSRWVHGLGELKVDNAGQPLALMGTITDITDHKQSEETINKLNEELEERVIQRTEQLETANKELESFSYSVSHDLRAPLRAVHGYTKILLEEYRNLLDDEGKRICDIISGSATQMGELIDDLLSFSRIGRSNISPAEINMKKMAKEIFSGLISHADGKRLHFKVGNLPGIHGDIKLMGQVWTNLISNAIKYTSKNEISEILIGSSVSDKMIIYFIKDNGVGFDMQYAHKLFGVFQRLHSESEFEGNGVGLAIVQRIILKHGGKAWAEGEVGKGATFYFSLPVKGVD